MRRSHPLTLFLISSQEDSLWEGFFVDGTFGVSSIIRPLQSLPPIIKQQRAAPAKSGSLWMPTMPLWNTNIEGEQPFSLNVFSNHVCFRSSVAGLFSSFPSLSKRDPWQGQSQECSMAFQRNAQPKCGHLGLVGRSKLTAESIPLIKSCLCSMLRWGENRVA